MLSAPHRLRKTRDIERVFKEGRGLREGSLFVKSAKNDLKSSRFAFVAGQKVSKKATERNTVKRRLREIVGKEIEEIKPGFDVVITALQGSSGKSLEELKSVTDNIFKKSRLIK